MRINFTAKTNRDYCMINTAVFTLPEGTTFTVDRDETEYSVENGTLSMTWRGAYLWAVNGFNIFCGMQGESLVYLSDYGIQEFRGLITDAKVSFELEDDAPDDDYAVEITDYSISW